MLMKIISVLVSGAIVGALYHEVFLKQRVKPQLVTDAVTGRKSVSLGILASMAYGMGLGLFVFLALDRNVLPIFQIIGAIFDGSLLGALIRR